MAVAAAAQLVRQLRGVGVGVQVEAGHAELGDVLAAGDPAPGLVVRGVGVAPQHQQLAPHDQRPAVAGPGDPRVVAQQRLQAVRVVPHGLSPPK